MTTDAPALPPVMTVERVARLFGVEPTTIRSWIAKGWISGAKIGARTYFTPRDVEDALAAARSRQDDAR